MLKKDTSRKDEMSREKEVGANESKVACSGAKIESIEKQELNFLVK